MIEKYCKKLKYRRKVVLVTNGSGTIDGDDISEITKKITEDAIELIVMFVRAGGFTKCLLISSRGVDFDDPEYGFKEEDKDPQKVRLPPHLWSTTIIAYISP